MEQLLKGRILFLLTVGILVPAVTLFFFFSDLNLKKLNPFVSPKITIVSGIYIKGQFLNGKAEHHYAGETFPLSEEGDIEVMLRDKQNNILLQSRVPSFFSMEVLSSKGSEYIDSRDVVPVSVSFPYTPKAIEAVVVKNDNILFSTKLK